MERGESAYNSTRAKCWNTGDLATAPRSYHLRARTLSLLATITDLGALAGSSRKHTNTYPSMCTYSYTYIQRARYRLLSQLRVLLQNVLPRWKQG